MSLGLIKPGMRSASLAGKIHPKTGKPLKPIGYLKDGTVLWPVLGAAPDDPNDPKYTGENDDDDDDEDEEESEEDDEDKSKRDKGKRKDKGSSDDDEEDEEDEEKLTRPERQAARYRTRLREQERQNKELRDRLKALEDKDKKPDEIVSRDLTEAESKLDKMTATNRQLLLENAFFRANTVDWVDPADVLRLIDLEDVDVDEDGTVDARGLRAALKDLAKRKPHLVKQAKSNGSASDDDDDEEEEEERPRRSARSANGQRKGSKGTSNKDALAKKFPVLRIH